MGERETYATRSFDSREDAAALRGESRQTRRRAAGLHAEANLILDTVAEMTARALETRGFELRAPVAARFRTARAGSTGVEVVVRLEDPSQANLAKAALAECFPDPLSVVTVS
jgi:hypothetical protein